MATLLERSGIARDMYSTLNIWMNRTRGGVAVVTALMAVVMAESWFVLRQWRQRGFLEANAARECFRRRHHRPLPVGRLTCWLARKLLAYHLPI